MARAFREGVEQNRRIKTHVRRRNWSPLRDLRGLKTRTERIGEAMGPLVEIPAMVRIENEHWVFERIEEGVLHNLTHKLILHETEGQKVIALPKNITTNKTKSRSKRHGKHHIQLIASSSSGSASPLIRAQTVLWMVSGLEVLS